MAEEGLEALLITGEYMADENYRYFSGHRAVTKRRSTMMLLPKDHDPILITSFVAKTEASIISWVKDIRTYGYEGLTSKLVKEVLHDLGLGEAKMGAELDDSHDAFRINMRHEEFMRLQREMPKTKFLDASDIIWKLRMIKSNAEIECLRKAAEITSKAYDAWFSTIKEGMTEKEASRILFNLFVDNGADFGGSPPNITSTMIWFGRPGCPRNPTDRPLRRGDLIMIDGGACYKGYCVDFSRGCVVGTPSESQKRIWKHMNKVTKKCVEAARPGVKVSDISKVALKTFVSLGLDTSFIEKYHIGHGIGLNFPEPPMIRITDDALIEPGMVLTVEPIAFYGGPVIEQDFIVTEDGYEVISTASTELRVI